MSKLAIVVVAALLVAAGRCPAQEDHVEPVRTGFDPRVDGLPFVNASDWAQPGNCWGMSLLAIDAYLQRLATGQPGSPREGSRRATPEEAASASVVQAALIQFDAERSPRTPVARATGPLREALARIAASGVPEVLTFDGPGGGHAVVLFGWEAGGLRIYDPNRPGETIEWPFDPETGLGAHPLAALHPLYRVANVRSTPHAGHAVSRAVSTLREACTNQEEVCLRMFPPLSVDVRREARGTIVTGSVAAVASASPPDRVWLVVDGRPINVVPVSRFGTYRVAVPDAALTPGVPNRVHVVATVGDDARFAGFRRLELPGPPPPRARPVRTPGLTGAVSRRR